MSIISEFFALMYNADIPEAKFKIGEEVNYKHCLKTGKGKIIGINDTGEGIEYAVEGFDFLLWEEELSTLKKE